MSVHLWFALEHKGVRGLLDSTRRRSAMSGPRTTAVTPALRRKFLPTWTAGAAMDGGRDRD